MSVPPFRPPVAEPLHGPDWVRPAGNREFRVTQDWDAIDPVYPSVRHRALDLGDGDVDIDGLYAPAAGVIEAEGYLREPWSLSSTLFGTGNFGGIMCVIRHDGYTSALAHLSKTIVNVGQRVLEGQLIGYIGDTGAAKGRGAHVHWDLYRGVPRTWTEREAMKVDPWPLLRQNYRLPDTGTVSPEADMRFSGSELHIVDGTPSFRLTVDARFRSAPAIAENTIKVFDAGTMVRAAWSVDGQNIDGNDDWLLAAMYTGAAYETGYFHSSVVERVIEPVPPSDPALQEALDAANKRSAAILDAADTALGLVAQTAETERAKVRAL